LAFSQNTSELNPPLYKGVSVHVDGVYVTPVPSLPLTAVVEIESTLIFADGSTVVKKTVNNIARDFQRRIYNERRQLVSPSFNGTPKLLSFHIFDPVTRLNTFLDPATHIARQTTRSEAKQEAGLTGARWLVHTIRWWKRKTSNIDDGKCFAAWPPQDPYLRV